MLCYINFYLKLIPSWGKNFFMMEAISRSTCLKIFKKYFIQFVILDYCSLYPKYNIRYISYFQIKNQMYFSFNQKSDVFYIFNQKSDVFHIFPIKNQMYFIFPIKNQMFSCLHKYHTICLCIHLKLFATKINLNPYFLLQ